MANLLIIILDDLNRMPALLQALRRIGVPGATILESAGAYRVESWLSRVGLGGLDRMFESREVRRRTILAAIEEEDLLAQAIAEAEQVMGGFDRPDSGLLLVLPVSQVKGLHKIMPKEPQDELPPAVYPNWVELRDKPVEEAVAILDTPEMKDVLAQQGFVPDPRSGEALLDQTRHDIARWKDVIAKAGITAE